MRTLLIASLIFICGHSFGQQKDSVVHKKFDYLFVWKVNNLSVSVIASSANKAIEEAVNSKKYKNIIDCVNFLEDSGWEVIDVNIAQTDMTASREFVLRKPRK
jgi:CO dehydrogenase/acetyl-CoA synthase epsilon subunit